MIDSKLKEKLAEIKLLILDVDGVLTDGKIILGNDGNEIKNFDVKDGLGMLLLQKFGIKLAVITGKTSKIVETRLMALGVKDVYQGQKNKLQAFDDLLAKYEFTPYEVAYMGDDLPDLAIMAKSLVTFAPSDAVAIVKSKVDYVTLSKGGQGAVREICDLILDAKGVYQVVLQDFITFGEVRG
ncbi:KdsC family phosphatase [Caedibacter taeniospiralis]|uniref:KdsC family phosphatase n=1 Tax=Caedibacter taeniospiralis TaxID=28907 RepID=UPI000C2727C7|nr:HAD-IIIA family hydrolase [Caedibacter taeniospiralis]